MKIPSPVAKRRVRIEIIPLIDIVFFLLATFVMVSLSMVKNQGISVNLPASSTSSQQENKPALTITVKEDGSVYVDKTHILASQMAQVLKSRHADDPELKVLINGDEKAYFGKAVAILDEIRHLGITKVAIRTKSPDKGN